MLIFKIFIYALIFLFVMIILLIIGEYISSKFPNSKFKKWWNSNVITHVSDDYDR